MRMDESRESANLYWMLLQVALRSKHGLMKMADAHGLTVMQMQTLCTMEPREPIPMSTASCFLACDRSNVTGIVDRLLAQGYIAREEKPEDRRVKMITLTLKGEKLRKDVLDELAEYELPEFKLLNSEQKKQLAAILCTILRPPLPNS
jgi:DNA-binding MarR family transcriptional regulator